MYAPGEWQAQMIQRLLRLGYDGFRYDGPEGTWHVMKDQKVISGASFRTTDQFDAWLDQRESSPV
jgi:hypothetical protein